MMVSVDVADKKQGIDVIAKANGLVLLRGALTMATVPQAASKLERCMADQKSIRLDCSGIQVHDSAILAMFLECVRSARSKDQAFTIVNAPDSLIGLAKVSGIDTIIPFG
jgi:anti-anti-sigma factor